MLTLMPRITVVTARRVFGDPWAHIRRSVPVCANYQHCYACERNKAREIYRHDLPPLANDALLGAYINDSTVERPTRLLDQTRDQEHARLSSDALKLLPRAIPAQGCRPITTTPTDIHGLEPAGHPVVARARALAHHVAEVDGLLKVPQVLVAALGAAAADDAAEGRAARVAAQVGLGQQEDVGGVVAGGAAGDLAQLGEGGRGGGLRRGGACRQADLAWGWVGGHAGLWRRGDGELGGL